MTPHEIVSQKEWLVTRKELLMKEKELTKLRDQLSTPPASTFSFKV
jgi:predicted dithiol-disulfide oxidoreductase (DUF899 family)